MRLFGLIGFPLAHSFSEEYFTRKFQSAGLTDHVYRNFPISRVEEIENLIKDNPELVGLNVTIPYKEEVMHFLDELSPEALQVGAVNCIHMVDGKRIGYNTDVFGFSQSIKPFLENKFERALILGTGGAAKAAAAALRAWGMPFYHVSRNRRNERTIGYEDLNAGMMAHFHLIIQATPLGTFPATEVCPPIPYEAIGPAHFLYDMVYNPEESLFLRKGREAGAQTMNGLKMLHLQADRSWDIWNGKV